MECKNVSALCSLLLEANRENLSAVLEDCNKQVSNTFKITRANDFISEEMLSQKFLDPSRLASISAHPLPSTLYPLDNSENKKKNLKRRLTYDNDSNATSINKRNYFFNKKLYR